jgi:hypothetical protein
VPHWLAGGQSVTVRDAATIFGAQFGYQLSHNEAARTVTIDIHPSAPPNVRYIYMQPGHRRHFRKR